MMKKISFFILTAAVLILPGCKIPFTDIVVTIPFLEKRPDVLLKETVTNMSQLQSVHFGSTLSYQGDELPMAKGAAQVYGIPTELLARVPSGQSVSLSGQAEGDMKFSEDYHSASTFTTNINVNGRTGAMAGETRTIIDQIYLKLTTLPQLPGSTRTPLIKDQWIHITTLQNLAQELEERGLISDTLSSLRDELLKKKEQVSQGENNLDAIISILAKKRAGKRLPDETVNNQATYHYRIDLTSENVAEIMSMFSTASGNPASVQQYAEYLEQLEEGVAEIWIGKKDSYLYRFTMRGQARSKNDPSATIAFDVRGDFSGFNENVNIEAPADAKSIDQFLISEGNGIIPSLGQTLLNNLFQTESTPIDTDQDGLTDEQEAQYGTKSDQADSDSDGYPDGQEVESGYNPNGPGKL